MVVLWQAPPVRHSIRGGIPGAPAMIDLETERRSVD
jgi:hypothetical protein